MVVAAPMLQPPKVLPQPWARAWGEDEYGIWTELELHGVAQRLRWIAPGTFLMGSPANEPERDDDELQHEVVLTRGFWLADTACTQALWQAVMGESPSRFKGDERPVENVSWEDCQLFLERVTSEEDLGLRLPTEAEWEYACRAGTTTPFWFGETVSTDQVNFDGNYPYAGGPKSHYREETVPVGSLPVNSWGLYEMHGNVREWCADWFGPYEDERVIDPPGPEKGDYRVLRGGSWLNGARNCRSASRRMTLPGFQYGFIGLRLARGQESQVGKEPATGS